MYTKVTFFLSKKIFLLFFAELKLLTIHINIEKISEKMNKRNVLKIYLQATYPTDFCVFCIHFYYGKKWNILCFKNQWLE